MKHWLKSWMSVFLIILLTFGTCCTALASSSQLVNQTPPLHSLITDGQILFAPLASTTTYLLNADGTINHTWPSSYYPGIAVKWLGNGTILRSILVTSGTLGGGTGGGVQKVDWNGNLLWQYKYNTGGNLPHHDIKMLPNGNVLIIAWETKTRAEAIAAGRKPTSWQGSTFLPDHIIEVKPTGPTSGDIVWKWHAWDHLIQHYDPSKANYGVIVDHPELIDINYGGTMSQPDLTPDWLHTNSIDYNEQLDQILISVHNFDEIWVIDHSTTTQQAAGHIGGRYGRGGDLLYRWGNPATYQRGGSSDHKLFGQHDATWIRPGYPGAGHILIFNNGYNRQGTKYSSVDEIVPPVGGEHGYTITSGQPFGPPSQYWIYQANPVTNFYSSSISGAQRLKNGNTLICHGEKGLFFEVKPDGTQLWSWKNPYPNPSIDNEVFKTVYIPPNEPPVTPVITGPDNGSIGVSYSFNAMTSDPNGDNIYYLFDWDDGSSSGWIGPYGSNVTATASHMWRTPGTYNVKVKAKDDLGSESGWSTPHRIVVSSAPIIEIGSITGGLFKVNVEIKNTGDVAATNVIWKIELTGGFIILGKATTGQIATLPVNGTQTVTSNLIFGFGKTKVAVTSRTATKLQNATVLLVYIKI